MTQTLTLDQLRELIAARPAGTRVTSVSVERNANISNVADNGAMIIVSGETKSDGTVKSAGSILQGYRKLLKSRKLENTVTVDFVGADKSAVAMYRPADLVSEVETPSA